MLWLAALLLSASAGVTEVPAFAVDRWGVEDGLPNNALSAIVQSRDGHLWIATWAAVVRFDGARFTPVAENLPNAHARVLLEDRDGAMWIGVSGGGLARWRAGALDVFTTEHGLAGLDVRALAQDPGGRIWVGTNEGLSVLEQRRATTIGRAEGLPDDTITALAATRGGDVWVATPHGVCVVPRGTRRCQTIPGLAGQMNAIVEDRDGTVWVGGGAGLLTGHPTASVSPCVGGCFRGRAVTALQETDHGLWVGFGDGEVALLRDGREVARYGGAQGLPTSGPVVAIRQDAEGSIWIATYNGGLERLRPKRVVMYSMADGLPANAVGSIVQDREGTIWAGAQCGPISQFVEDHFVPRFTDYLRGTCAWVIWPARDGSLWIGTRGQGLFHWQNGRMRHFDRADGLSDVYICGLFEGRDGVIWIGTELGGLHTYANGQLSRAYGPSDGVATPYLASFAQDREGRIWIGSNAAGLSVYERGRFRTLSSAEAPPTRNIANLLVDSRGDLWIGSAADGLFRRRGGRYERFGLAEGLGDRLVAVLLEDRFGTIWVSTAHGITRLTRDRIDALASRQRASLDPIILDRTDGLLNTEGSGGGLDPSGLVDRDGKLWFSTIDGIAVVDPARFTSNPVEPRVLIEEARVAGRLAARDAAGAIHVGAGASVVEIAYTAFSFLAPAKVRFRYRLAGYDEWQDVGARRTAYYTRLPPGSYRFEVVAANNDGVWARAPAVATLIVAPFWWERRPPQVAALVLLLAAMALAVRSMSTRRARARLAALEQERALDRERSRIARDLHDDLGSRLSHIAIMAQSAGVPGRDARLFDAARDAVRTIDELVWAVNARNDTVESFAYYISQFAEEHVVAAGLRCRLALPPELPARPLTADVRRHLYLAFKEALTNAIRHARATEVRVSLAVEDSAVVVDVADNGAGIPDRVDPAGNGLGNMRERMQAARGTLEVETGPDRGTRIRFRAPLG